jgi:beta-glucosidase
LPFKAAIAANTGAIMPSYGIPMGKDTVGVNFSKKMVTGLLRNKLGYQGIIVTDWLRGMPWGVEDLSQQEREHQLLDAGVDQLGGEHDSSFIVNLVKSKAVRESRIDASVMRILLVMFRFGLFENPYVDPVRAKEIVGNAQFAATGEDAQRKAVVLLKNAHNLLPLRPYIKVYGSHIDPGSLGKYAEVVSDPSLADALLIKVNAPYALHKGDGNFFKETHEGTLAYAGSNNAEELQEIEKLRTYGKPVIVIVSMERPAVLSEFASGVQGILATFGSSDQALLDILFGKVKPVGKLPFDLPRDMKSVLLHKEDAAHDLKNPLFPFGFGMTYLKK